MIAFWILFWILVSGYALGAAVVLVIALFHLGDAIHDQMTSGRTYLDEEELLLLKQGLLFFWAWPVIAAPYVKDIFNSGEST